MTGRQPKRGNGTKRCKQRVEACAGNTRMRKRRKPDIMKLMIEGKQIDEALARAVREAVKQHVRAGNPIAVMRNGKVCLLKPSEVRLPEEP